MNQQELSHALRKEAIKNGHSVQTLASGHSMFPFLRKGDILTVEPIPMDKVQRGDVVVFESEEKWIAHRVIKIRKGAAGLEFLLRGDTCIKFDPVVNKKNYKGIVIAFKRKSSENNLAQGRFLFWKKIINALGYFYNLSLYVSRMTLSLKSSIRKKEGRN